VLHPHECATRGVHRDFFHPWLSDFLFPSTLPRPTSLAQKASRFGYAPLIQSLDRCLSGWKALLLSSRGRLVLCNVVPNNLATYYMCLYLLPQGVIDCIEKRRRAFFWTGKDSCLGARYLIAWDKPLLSKHEGGFGIRDLHRQNMCLLLNFIDILHLDDSLPWKSLFWEHYCRDLGVMTSSPSFIDKLLLPASPSTGPSHVPTSSVVPARPSGSTSGCRANLLLSDLQPSSRTVPILMLLWQAWWLMDSLAPAASHDCRGS
jgi:hypothetical protein